MTWNEELSIEETNKQRIALGLKPLPVPEKQEQEVRESITVDETNRLRASLGLPPIQPDVDTTNVQSTVDQDRAARENFLQKYKEDEEKEAEKRREEDQERDEERQRRTKKLDGQSIGQSNQLQSATSFLKSLKRGKKRKAVAVLEQEEEEEEEQQYTGKDVAGLKVAHKLSQVQDLGSGAILTLKDQDVMDEQGEDELESTSLREQERLDARLESKKGVKRFKGWEDGKYIDRMDDGKEQESFVLGEEIAGKKDDGRKMVVDTIDYEIDFGASAANTGDYKVSKKKKPVKFKKKSSKVSETQQRRKRDVFDDEEFQSRFKDEEDDFQLQSAMGKSRIQAQRARNAGKIQTPEEIAAILMAEQKLEIKKQDSGLSASRFLATLGQNGTDEPQGGETMDVDDSEGSVQTKDLQEPNGLDKNSTEETAIQVVEAGDQPEAEAEQSELQKSILSVVHEHESGTVADSMSAALSALRRSGRVGGGGENNSDLREKDIKIRDLKRQMAQELSRLEENNSGARKETIDKKSMAIQVKYAKQIDQLHKQYGFNVNVQHHDEQGNELDPKEAFKQLSHHFHGSAPGKQKIEKQMKKRQQEKKREAESIF